MRAKKLGTGLAQLQHHLKIIHFIAISNGNIEAGFNGESDSKIEIDAFEILPVYRQTQLQQIWVTGQ